jgi:acyl-coenzyme A synthetase/AMP-(fatty) acid ligase
MAIRKAVAEQYDLRVYDIRLLKAGRIPKTSSGKIQRHTCKAQYLAGTLDILEV